MAKFPTLLFLTLVRLAVAFPIYESLVGLSEREISGFVAYNEPGAAHPFVPAGTNDIRGPCLALNTLASHGYLPRNGIVRPDQLVTATMEGLNLANDFAKLLTYQTFLMNGNPITNLMSLGLKSSFTGPDPPKPAQVDGLSPIALRTAHYTSF
ncbi:hypothetical protein M422DRAFT_276581 [Sphaerobolus stellatus SS14]|uniref:Heme haloperoxidase family profile domain-containing protein n=1 Tax=Sphaerobolus stellatus (strain SS14) TaxID=990650 RepID=A0A0C9TM88_SPHS4|nr:hypothetical protein M422DRAFT_276581 [Sphaerobolus stellatus SS14]